MEQTPIPETPQSSRRGVPPQRSYIPPCERDLSEDEYRNPQVMSRYENIPPMTPEDISIIQDDEFWTAENVQRVVQQSRLAHQSSKDIAMNEETYKWIRIKFDQESDDRHNDLNMKRLDSRDEICHVSENEFQQLKEDIRWDIAWKIFDQVNKNLNTDMEINLNCLDIEEALAISKQKIYDVAQIAQMEQKYKGSGNREAKDYVLIILCGNDHFAVSNCAIQADIPDTSIDDVDEKFAFSYAQKKSNCSQATTSGSSLSNKYNPRNEFGIAQPYYTQVGPPVQQRSKRNKQKRQSQVATNQVLDMIQNELRMESFYIENSKVILVRIDDRTIENPILANW